MCFSFKKIRNKYGAGENKNALILFADAECFFIQEEYWYSLRSFKRAVVMSDTRKLFNAGLVGIAECYKMLGNIEDYELWLKKANKGSE